MLTLHPPPVRFFLYLTRAADFFRELDPVKEADAAPVMAEDVLDKVCWRYFPRRMYGGPFWIKYIRDSEIHL